MTEHYTSYEVSKQLFEYKIGCYNQKHWVTPELGKPFLVETTDVIFLIEGTKWFPAYTAGELLEQLLSLKVVVGLRKHSETCFMVSITGKEYHLTFDALTMCDALALALIEIKKRENE